MITFTLLVGLAFAPGFAGDWTVDGPAAWLDWVMEASAALSERPRNPPVSPPRQAIEPCGPDIHIYGSYVTTHSYPEAEAALLPMVRHLASANGIRDPFCLAILDAPEANAFMTFQAPAAMAITVGMLQALENDSQLAGILGHELAHLYVHYDRPEIYRSLPSPAMEEQADLVGMRFARRAGYDSIGLAAGLYCAVGEDRGTTHPSIPKRMDVMLQELPYAPHIAPGGPGPRPLAQVRKLTRRPAGVRR